LALAPEPHEEEQGLTLCQGESRDYVIDAEGALHALGKRVLGISAAELRAFMADVEREGQGYPALVDEGENVAPRISTPRAWPRALTGWACAA